MTPKILVLHNAPTLPADHPDADSEHDIVETADSIVGVLRRTGLSVEKFGFVDDPRDLLQGISNSQPDAVFNLYEGTAKWGNTEAYVTGILEMLRIPFTGSPTQPLILARSKPLTKQLLLGAGLPTARSIFINSGPACENTLGWPVIVKPAREDASVGIDQKSVVKDQRALAERVAYLQDAYGPEVLVEEFIVGREFHVPIWERDGMPVVLPYTEVFFEQTEGPDPLWPIVSFDAKWKENSRDYKATPVINPAVVEPGLRARVDEIALSAYRLLGCRDYARIDFRVRDDQPYVLEVNPNPCISPLAGVAEALASSRVPFPIFVLELVRSALRRGRRPELANFANPPSDVVDAMAAELKPPPQTPEPAA